MQDISSTHDKRFDEAEAELNRGTAWRFRDPDAPNPLTIIVTGWSTGHTKHGEAEFLNGLDRNETTWSVLVGSLVLRKRLIDGDVTAWDDAAGRFVTVDVQGRAQPGEVISIRYKGDVESANGKVYPDFEVARKPVPAAETPAGGGPVDGDIPF